jgi:hypothetical protein
MEGFQWEKTKPIWARGLADHTSAPNFFRIFPKFPHKSLNSFLPLNLEILKENIEKGKSYSRDNYTI